MIGGFFPKRKSFFSCVGFSLAFGVLPTALHSFGMHSVSFQVTDGRLQGLKEQLVSGGLRWSRSGFLAFVLHQVSWNDGVLVVSGPHGVSAVDGLMLS